MRQRVASSCHSHKMKSHKKMKHPVIAKESIKNAPQRMQCKEQRAKPHSVNENTRLNEASSAESESCTSVSAF